MDIDSLLRSLQDGFPPGATSGTFYPSAVDGGAFAPLCAQLGIPDALSLTSATGWVQDGDTLSFSGTCLTAVLGVQNAPVYIQLTPAGAEWTLLMDLTLPATWTFGQSFAMLAAGVFAELRLADGSASALVVASGPAADPLRGSGGALAVSDPLTFTGTFDRASSAWAQIAWLAGDAGRVTGAVAYDAASQAVAMDIPLARGSVAHVAGTSGPALSLALALYSGLDAALGQYLYGIRFETEVDFDTQAGPRTITLAALMTVPGLGVLELSVAGTAFAFPTPAALARWFGARHDLPGQLPDPFQDGTLLQVTALTLGVGLRSHTLEYAFLALGALQGVEWDVAHSGFVVTDVDVTFAAFGPLGDTPSYSLSLGGTLAFGGVEIRVDVTVPDLRMSGQLPALAPRPPVSGLLEAILGTDAGVPPTLLIETLAFSADVPSGVDGATVDVAGKWAFAFGDSNLVIFEELRIEAQYAPEGAAGSIMGRFAVGPNEFLLEADLAAGELVFLGTWVDQGDPLGYQDLAIALGMYGLPTPPQLLDLSFTAAAFQFETAGPTFAFTIDTAEYGRGTLVAGRDAAGAWGFVFGMEAGMDLALELTDIPVVGDLVPSGMDVIALDDLRIVGATATIPLFTPTQEMGEILGPVVNSGLVLSIQLRLGTDYVQVLSVRFGGADDDSELDAPPPPLELPGSAPGFVVVPSPPLSLAVASPPATAAAGPQYSWVNVQRAFGPVQFARIGFAITPGESLALAIDGSVSLAGLTIALTGLAAEIPLHAPYVPSFALAGLAVEYAAAGLEVGGALVKVPGADPAMYSGDLVFEIERFGALAFGSYTTAAGSPSLFAFLFLDVPLGGPGFFFVTGLAGGFGFNRTLTLPTIDTVASYPLVQGAMGVLDARSTVAALDAYIRPAPNEYWFAAGIRFTSYGLLRSYVLATVAFGATVEVGLMGQSTLALPPVGEGEEAGGALQPLAEADLVLLVDFAPSSGVLAVAAQLSPASYVLSRQAHLTGGFAFYVWFPPSAHAGDFVVSLGGYNPYFTAPAHYPAVPRLGFSWTLSTELSITGGVYCALTPAVVMAGGSLRASWKGGGLTAWFTAQADFVVRLKPFAYSVRIGVSVGVSYTVNLGLTTKTISLQVSGDVELWGQPFGGRAWVDAGVLSFSFTFGEPRADAPADLGWDAFRDSFLPPVQSSPTTPSTLAAVGAASLDASLPAPTATDSLVAIHAPSGLLGTFTDEGDSVWRVDPAALRLVVATQVPSKTAAVHAAFATSVAGGWSTEFGVGPMGAAPAEVAVALSISLTRGGQPDGGQWSAAAVVGNVPAGVWLSTTAQMDAAPLVTGVLTAVELVPVVPPPDATLPVPIDTLLGGPPPVRGFTWSTTLAPVSDGFDQASAMAQVQRTLVDPAVDATRAGILSALRTQGLRTAASVEVAAFAAQAPELMSSPPQLRLLGELPAPPA